jgi:hypothetical protein
VCIPCGSKHTCNTICRHQIVVLHAWEYCNDYLTVEGQNIPKETAAWYGQYTACTIRSRPRPFHFQVWGTTGCLPSFRLTDLSMSACLLLTYALSIYCGTSYMYFQYIKKNTLFSLTDLTTSSTAPLSQAFCYFVPSFWKKQKYICKHSFCKETDFPQM